MDNKTKEYYRNKIKEISKKTKISEIYITRKILELANEKLEGSKQRHIGYFLISHGKKELYQKLNYNNKGKLKTESKVKLYICGSVFLSVIISLFISSLLNINIENKLIYLISFIIFIISDTVFPVNSTISSNAVK